MPLHTTKSGTVLLAAILVIDGICEEATGLIDSPAANPKRTTPFKVDHLAWNFPDMWIVGK
jgi:hypothetical protein